jgi:hypothetical protein
MLKAPRAVADVIECDQCREDRYRPLPSREQVFVAWNKKKALTSGRRSQRLVKSLVRGLDLRERR